MAETTIANVGVRILNHTMAGVPGRDMTGRDLLEVPAAAGRPLRAGNIAAAAGLSTDKSKIEGLRSKPKRLAGRGWLAEDGPGLFALPRRGAQDASRPSPGSGQAGSASLGSRCEQMRTRREEEPGENLRHGRAG